MSSCLLFLENIFLFPEVEIKRASSAFSIKKYSDLYFANYPSDSLEKINEGGKISLTKEDYDFVEDPYFKKRALLMMEKESYFEKYFQLAPTFYAEYQSGRYKNYYRPPEIVVISSAWTYSSGYTLMAMLYKLGAKIVGIPSGQSGNCFGDTLMFQLKNSGLLRGIK